MGQSSNFEGQIVTAKVSLKGYFYSSKNRSIDPHMDIDLELIGYSLASINSVEFKHCCCCFLVVVVKTS